MSKIDFPYLCLIRFDNVPPITRLSTTNEQKRFINLMQSSKLMKSKHIAFWSPYLLCHDVSKHFNKMFNSVKDRTVFTVASPRTNYSYQGCKNWIFLGKSPSDFDTLGKRLTDKDHSQPSIGIRIQVPI